MGSNVIALAAAAAVASCEERGADAIAGASESESGEAASEIGEATRAARRSAFRMAAMVARHATHDAYYGASLIDRNAMRL